MQEPPSPQPPAPAPAERLNPLQRLRADTNANGWWQAVLNNPYYAMVLEAAKFQLEQSPEQFAGATSMETMALLYAAQRGGNAVFAVLETLGSSTLTKQRVAEQQADAAARATAPAIAGQGPGRFSPPPPEIRDLVPPPVPPDPENG